MVTLEKLYDCLRDESNEIIVSDEVAKDAIKPIQRMLQMS
jgi:quinolinate synthase